jgi:hypothetical protein
VFILSPASTSGKRAELIFSPRAKFDVARRLHAGAKAPIGEVFSFLSGLYFRGKLAYADRFANGGLSGKDVLVVTPLLGLVPPTRGVRLNDLRDFANVPIDVREPLYRKPLERDLRKLAKSLADSDEVVLLGSIATGKYVDIMLPFLGERLLFPIAFVGIGDMSRGSMMLKSARSGEELEYVKVLGAIRSHAGRRKREQ